MKDYPIFEFRVAEGKPIIILGLRPTVEVG
jgi:hypothetical protein